MNDGLSTEVLRDAAAVAAIAGEWRALPVPVAAPCPPAGPDFLAAWLATLGRAALPRVVAVRRGGALIGVVPLVAHALPARDGGRQVSLAGSRRPPLTDLADVRVVPGEEMAVAAATAAALDAAAATWDTLYLGNVAASSRTLAALMAQVELRGWSYVSRARTAMVIDTADGWDAYRAGLGRSLRRMPRRLRRLEALGEVRIELGATGAAGAAALDELFALYGERWGPGNWLDDPAYRELLHRLRAALDPEGARVAGIWLDGRPVAMQLVFREGTRDQCLLVASTRAEPAAGESPGTLLDYLLAEHAHADGTTEVHLLHTVSREKLGWATRLDSELTWIAVSPAARPRAAMSVPLVEGAISARAVGRRLRSARRP